jgi:hypothetical protein
MSAMISAMGFSFLDGVFCVSLTKNAGRRAALLQALASVPGGDLLSPRIRFFYPPDTVSMFPAHTRTKFADLGCAASHRECCMKAKERGWKTILVLEDDALPTKHFDAEVMRQEVDEANGRGFQTLNLGGCDPGWRAGTAALQAYDHALMTCGVKNMVTTHAVVYSWRAFSRMELFLPSHREVIDSGHQMQTGGAFDQWLSEGEGNMRAGYYPHFTQDAKTSDIVAAGHTTDVGALIEKTYEHLRDTKRAAGVE